MDLFRKDSTKKNNRKDRLMHGYRWINENKTVGISKPTSSPRSKPVQRPSQSSVRKSSGGRKR